MEKIVYPISIQYRKNWGFWEAFREIYQNSLDEAGYFIVKKSLEGVTIFDNGNGFSFKHLILGVTDKKIKNPRGKHGEGLKIAMIVFLRNGYVVKVHTGDLLISSVVEEIENESVFAVEYTNNAKHKNGTTVFIKGYNGDVFENRIIKKGDKRIIFSSNKGQIVAERPSGLYVRDIFCQGISQYRYSYNSPFIKLDEGNVADPYDIRRCIGYIWSSVDDVSLIRTFYKAVRTKKGEYGADLVSIQKENIGRWKKAFYKEYGNNAVLSVDKSASKRLKSIDKYVVVSFPKDLTNILAEFINTDAKVVEALDEKKEVMISKSILSDDEDGNLSVCRKLVAIVDSNIVINPYNFLSSDAKLVGKEIRINSAILNDLQKLLFVVLYELAIAKSGVKELTVRHLKAVLDICSLVLSKTSL